jgi:hypothetical protein
MKAKGPLVRIELSLDEARNMRTELDQIRRITHTIQDPAASIALHAGELGELYNQLKHLEDL